jgi:Flp pilus assembly protein TadG
MRKTLRSRIVARLSAPARAARRLLRRQDGTAAVEFALVALPFLALLFAIIETGLVFFAGQALEDAVTESARKIMTGQAQIAGYDQEDFKNKVVCDYMNSGIGLFDCQKVMVSVKTYSTFGEINTTPPIEDGELKLDPKKLPYQPGSPGDIVVVSLYYRWPISVSLLNENLTNVGGDRLLVASSVFRNEPFPPP